MTFGVHGDASNYCFIFSPVLPTLLGAPVLLLCWKVLLCCLPMIARYLPVGFLKGCFLIFWLPLYLSSFITEYKFI